MHKSKIYRDLQQARLAHLKQRHSRGFPFGNYSCFIYMEVFDKRNIPFMRWTVAAPYHHQNATLVGIRYNEEEKEGLFHIDLDPVRVSGPFRQNTT